MLLLLLPMRAMLLLPMRAATMQQAETVFPKIKKAYEGMVWRVLFALAHAESTFPILHCRPCAAHAKHLACSLVCVCVATSLPNRVV